MKITVLGVGSEAQYQATFDTAYQYLKKETAPLAAELSYSICRPEAAARLEKAMDECTVEVRSDGTAATAAQYADALMQML